jgi:hypothetical protein
MPQQPGVGDFWLGRGGQAAAAAGAGAAGSPASQAGCFFFNGCQLPRLRVLAFTSQHTPTQWPWRTTQWPWRNTLALRGHAITELTFFSTVP